MMRDMKERDQQERWELAFGKPKEETPTMINKMPSIKQAIERYGAIDFAAKVWPDQQKWMVMLHVDHLLFPNWKVLGTDHLVSVIYCNGDMAQALKDALHEISARGHGAHLHTFDGCFNIRMVRGSSDRPSTHSYGLGLDINASENPLGSTAGGLYDHPEIVKCFKAQGFDWGGEFKHRKDPMHFSWGWEHTS